MIAPGRRRSFQRRVLRWYSANGRDLPWRKTRDPYAILVSEILSHQTQISRVVPVYRLVLHRYPTVHAMARAPLAEVKAITDPLGYKIRGQWLHGAALRVADRFAGAFPDTPRGASAFARRRPLYSERGDELCASAGRAGTGHQCGAAPAAPFWRDGDGSGTDRELWGLAAAVIPKGKGYLINQGLMDLGALICRSRSPRCEICPLQRSCHFRRRARQGSRRPLP